MTEADGLICAAPTCENPVPAQSGRGRRAIYCSPGCRPTAHQHIHRLGVEIVHEGWESGERPTGRVWSVRLHRGNRCVVVATELGRPSAEHLAAQISELLDSRPQREETPSTKI
jgi:hypothetical protein